MTYVLVSGKESAANCVTALHRPDALCRFDVPDFELSVTRTGEEGIVGSDAERSNVGTMSGNVEGEVADGID